MVQVGEFYIDRDKRNKNRVLKVTEIRGDKALLSIGFFNDKHEWYTSYHSTKIRVDRLKDQKHFTFWSAIDD